MPRWPDGGYGVPAPYLEALRRAGARTAIIAPGEEGEPEALLEPFDGLVLVGGGYVHPSTYGADPDTEHLYGVERDRDVFEIGLVHAADRLHEAEVVGAGDVAVPEHEDCHTHAEIRMRPAA